MSKVTLQPPIVGRENEIRVLEGHLKIASTGKGSLVLIAGEAGIGKTRLSEEFTRQATDRGWRILTGRCVPGALSPYLAFQDALEDYFGVKRSGKKPRPERLKESVKRASPEILEATPLLGNILKATAAVYREYRVTDFGPGSGSERTLHAVLEFLREISRKQPVLLVIDDLQWADSASIELLHFLARNCHNLSLLIIGTYRPEEILAKLGERMHPLADSLSVMKREGTCHEIFLEGLKAAELKSAIISMLGHKIDNELLKIITSESDGNPLYAIEVVRLLVQSESIALQNEVWKPIKPISQIDIPSTVREVILRRLEGLPEEKRRLLESASIIGEWFDPGLLEEVLQTARLKLLEELDSIERDFRLIRATEGLYRFTHEIIRRVVYDQISLNRRGELHRLTGRALEGRLPDEGLFGELAMHFCTAGDTGKCTKYSLQAGQGSLNRGALSEAIEHFQRVTIGTRDDPSHLDERLQALEGLGDAKFDVGLPVSALEFYGRFLELCRSPNDAVRVLRKSAETAEGSKSLEFLRKAESYTEGDPIEKARIKRIWGTAAFYKADYREAETLYSEAEKLFEANEATEEVARTANSFVVLFLTQGRVKEALAKLESAYPFSKNLQDPRDEAFRLWSWSYAYLHLGLAEEALDCLRRIFEIVSRFGSYSGLWHNLLVTWWIHLSTDDLISARVVAQEELDAALKTESSIRHALSNLHLALTEILLDRVSEGDRLFQRALELYESRKIVAAPSQESRLTAFIHVVRGELLAAKKEWAASSQEWYKGIELFGEGWYGLLLQALIRVLYAKYFLIKHGFESEAREQLELAAQAFERLENGPQLQRISKLLPQLE